MQSFFWQVLDSRPVYQNLVREIEDAVKNGMIPPEGNITWTQSQELPYFQACLKEAMRVRPAVGLNISRLVPPEGTELDGHFFPGGTSLAVNGWVLHRDKETFGQDADDFRPERWLEDEERSRRMERYMFQVCAWWLFTSFFSRPCERSLMLTSLNSLVEEVISASDVTSHFWKSTRSSRDFSAITASSWRILAGRSRSTRLSSWCKRV